MHTFEVGISRVESLEVEIQAATPHAAAQLVLMAHPGFVVESVSIVDTDKHHFVLGSCEVCLAPVLDTERYHSDEDGVKIHAACPPAMPAPADVTTLIELYRERLQQLVGEAAAVGVLLTAEQVPLKPLAMGHHRTVVSARAAKTSALGAHAALSQLIAAVDTQAGGYLMSASAVCQHPAAALAVREAATVDHAAARARVAVESEHATESLHTFLNAAAGEGLVLDGVDAADLYITQFPERYAAHTAQDKGGTDV